MRSPTSPRRLGAGRRLLWRSLLGGALVAGAVVLFTGCRENRDEVGTANVGLADLRAMVLPREQLGLLGIGLKLGRSSGWRSNRAAAEDSIDPDDTARSLARLGRLGGFKLTYTHPRGYGSPHEERPVSIVTEVELFRDDATASAYLRRSVRRDLLMRYKKLPGGVRIGGVEPFGGGDIGDEASGLRATVVIDDNVAYGTTVGFRRGRLVGSATVINSVDTGGPGDVRRIAGALEDRIEGVASGAIRGPAVKLPPAKWWHAVPDPRALTLAGRDVLRGARLTHGNYYRTPVSFSYIRNYDVRRARLGGSRIIYLRTMASSFKNARRAAREKAFAGSGRASDRMARAFLRAFYRKSDSRATGITARPLAAPDRDSDAFRFSFDAPTGRIAGVMLSVGRGRLRANVIVLGFERELRPEDVLALRGKLLARLGSA